MKYFFIFSIAKPRNHNQTTFEINFKGGLIICIIAIGLYTYLIIWSISVIFFWFFIADGEGLAYSIYLLTILTLTTFTISFLIQKNNYWKKYRWILVLAFGIMFMLAEYATFSAANMIEFNKFNLPEFTMIVFGSLISIIGILVANFLIKRK